MDLLMDRLLRARHLHIEFVAKTPDQWYVKAGNGVLLSALITAVPRSRRAIT